MNKPNFDFEKELWISGHKFVIGVDEVGRGAFAGQVVAGAVAFSSNSFDTFGTFDTLVIDDSKRMKPREREKSAIWIKENAIAWGIGEINVATINKIGIGKATKMAFRMAIKQVIKLLRNEGIKEEAFDLYLLIDGFNVKHIKRIGLKRQKAIVKGDQKSISIAAASIIAKVYRDGKMKELSKKFPEYGWAKNKGYGTKIHQEAIKKFGITKIHRKTFVKTFLEKNGPSG